jgi:hypothetical protein
MHHKTNARTAICSGVQVSRSTDLTFEMCVPMLRWIPEHRMQTKTPLWIDTLSNLLHVLTCDKRTCSTKPNEHLREFRIRANPTEPEGPKRTVPLAVCAELVVGSLHQFAQRPGMPLCGSFVLTRHGVGGLRRWPR